MDTTHIEHGFSSIPSHAVPQDSKETLRPLLSALEHNLKQLKKQLRYSSTHVGWHLLIGSHLSGKSSWLSQAHLETSQTLSSLHEKTRICITKQGVLFDLPGEYFESERPLLWEGLSRLFQKARGKKALQSLVVVFDLGQLLQQTSEERAASLGSIAKFLEKIQNFHPAPLPLHIVITQMDQLAGFCEFFDNLNERERQQSLGITFDPSDPKITPKNLIPNFDEKYLKLIENLQHRLIPLLHHERNPQKRAAIEDFPLQMEMIKNLLRQSVETLLTSQQHTPTSTEIFLSSLFFCSAIQDGKRFDCLERPISKNFNLESTLSSRTFATQKSYFVKGALNDITTPQKPQVTKPKPRPAERMLANKPIRPQHISYVVAGLILATGCWLIFEQFHKKLHQLHTAEQILQNYPNQHAVSASIETIAPTDMLRALDVLIAAQKHLAPVKNSYDEAAQNAYIQALQTQYLPWIARFLEQKIGEHLNNNPSHELYHLLKAYLLLGNLQHRQNKSLQNFLESLWKKEALFAKSEMQALDTHLKVALNHQKFPIPLNHLLVQQARKALITLPYPLLIYLTLKSEYETETVQLNSQEPPIPQKNVSGDTIPAIYTRERFLEMYDQKIPALSKTSDFSDWVLGQKTSVSNPMNQQELIEQVRGLYLSDYTNWWNLSLLKTKLGTFYDLKSAEAELTHLKDPKAPLLSLLKMIVMNTTPFSENTADTDHIASMQIFNQRIAEKFQGIHQLLDQNGKEKLLFQKIQTQTSALQKILHHINQSQNPKQTAFEIAKDIAAKKDLSTHPIMELMQLAKQTIDPLSHWLEEIANQSWQLIFNEAGDYLEEAWQPVYTEYQQHIHHRYPLVKDAQQEISLNRFTQFFGAKGRLEKFVHQYLSAFIDIQNSEWHPKMVFNKALPISEETVRQFERAHVIQQMFFTDHPDKPSVSFSLQPMQFEPIVKKLTLTINGQLLEDEQGDNSVSNFDWPGSPKTPLVQLEFNNINGQFTAITTEGEWAWFRLVDRSNLQPTQDPRFFQLMFDLNGNAAKYELVAKNAINPFIPDILSHFQAPEKILTAN